MEQSSGNKKKRIHLMKRNSPQLPESDYSGIGCVHTEKKRIFPVS